jgi:hypothetical protein
MNHVKHAGVSMLAVMTIWGCATAAPIEEAPNVTAETTVERQLIYNTNADGTWSADAHEPWVSGMHPMISGGATFAYLGGKPGVTRRMGVCLLTRFEPLTGCSDASDCNNAPGSLPPGGFRYCASANGFSRKYCYYRPGPPSAYCAGTPAIPGTPPIAAGTFLSHADVTVGTTWISYACFEGCTATDPSSSSLAKVVQPTCGDQECSPGEDFSMCPEDCSVCGDGYCATTRGEHISCPEDCH